NRGYNDCWVLKIDNVGTLVWQKTYGGAQPDLMHNIQLTQDSGFIMCGYSLSVDGDVGNNNGASDFWVVRLDNKGLILWSKAFGGYAAEDALCVKETPDHGCIVVGATATQMDGDVQSFWHGKSDFWVVKLDSVGS